MKHLAVALAAVLLTAGCVSSDTTRNEPNYVKSQIYQSPMPVGDTFGSTDNLPPAVGGLQ